MTVFGDLESLSSIQHGRREEGGRERAGRAGCWGEGRKHAKLGNGGTEGRKGNRGWNLVFGFNTGAEGRPKKRGEQGLSRVEEEVKGRAAEAAFDTSRVRAEKFSIPLKKKVGARSLGILRRRRTNICLKTRVGGALLAVRRIRDSP